MGLTSSLASVAVAVALSAAVPARADLSPLWPAPKRAWVVAVIDGDTVIVAGAPDDPVRHTVRLLGVDCPERRARCQQEEDAATAATNETILLIGGIDVTLCEVRKRPDRYGRTLARVSPGRSCRNDLSQHLIDAGLCRAYDGGHRRSWCGSPDLDAVPNDPVVPTSPTRIAAPEPR